MQLNNSADMNLVDTLQPLSEELTYGAIFDIRNVEQEITELMVRRACEQMDAEQQFPFCSAPRLRKAG